MSRIGAQPISIPQGASVTLEGQRVIARGPKGELTLSVPKGITVHVDGQVATVEAKGEGGMIGAQHGAIRANLKNFLTGVTTGWSKTLELSGVGYRAALSGENLTLNVGFSHQVMIPAPKGITFAVSEGKIVVSGADKHMVGQVAADVRAVKKPEPYKGKGIKYEGEYIRKKAGKSAKAVGGAPGAAGAK